MRRPSRPTFFLPAAVCVLLTLTTPTAAESVTVLAAGDVSAWRHHVFANIAPTRYQTKHDQQLGAAALFADSRRGASGYTLEQSFNLQKTPWLHFQWRVDEAAQGFNERQKSGDDCAFRLSFIRRKLAGVQTLMLVRATAGKTGQTWKSPYVSRVFDLRLYAFADGDSALQEWRSESINLAELWRRLFGEEAQSVGAVGLMVDGDSAGVVMKSRFGAIVLSDSATSPFAAR